MERYGLETLWQAAYLPLQEIKRFAYYLLGLSAAGRESRTYAQGLVERCKPALLSFQSLNTLEHLPIPVTCSYARRGCGLHPLVVLLSGGVFVRIIVVTGFVVGRRSKCAIGILVRAVLICETAIS